MGVNFNERLELILRRTHRFAGVLFENLKSNQPSKENFPTQTGAG